MKEKHLHIGTIALSASLVLALGLGMAKGLGGLAQSELGQTNSFEELSNLQAPLSYETRIQKGDQLFERSFYSLAANEYASAIQIQVENPEGYAKLGRTYEILGDPLKAENNFKKAWELSPNNPNYIAHYGRALFRAGSYPEAKTLFEGIEKETREKYFYLGLLALEAGDHENARKQFETALEKEGTLAEGTVQRFLDAYRTYEEKLDVLTLYRDALLTEASIKAEEYLLAINQAEQILKEEPNYRDIWTLLGYGKLKLSLYQEAEDAFKEAKRLDSLKPEVHYFLGMSHFLQEEYPEAVQSFELAVLHHFEPEAELYRKLAESQVKVGAYEEALEAYEYLVKIDRSDLELFVTPVWISVKQVQDLDRALSLAEESVNLFPKEAESYSLLAWVYLEKGDLEQSEANLQKGFALDPKLADLHFNSGLLEAAKGNKEQALEDFKRAYELAENGSLLSREAAQKYNELTLTKPE